MAMKPLGTMYGISRAGGRTRTHSESPSGRNSSMIPMSSTWPCTKWPLLRPSAGSARSTLTRSPGTSLSRLVRLIVSGARPTLNLCLSNSVTVRHTPLTAMLQPREAPSSATAASTSSSQPSPTVPSHCFNRGTFSSLLTLPISSTMPLNMAFATAARPASIGTTMRGAACQPPTARANPSSTIDTRVGIMLQPWCSSTDLPGFRRRGRGPSWTWATGRLPVGNGEECAPEDDFKTSFNGFVCEASRTHRTNRQDETRKNS